MGRARLIIELEVEAEIALDGRSLLCGRLGDADGPPRAGRTSEKVKLGGFRGSPAGR